MKENLPCFAYEGATCMPVCPLYDLISRIISNAKERSSEKTGYEPEELTLDLKKAGEMIQTLRAVGLSIPEEFIANCIRKNN
jgi:L-lactate utilization protein LutB